MQDSRGDIDEEGGFYCTPSNSYTPLLSSFGRSVDLQLSEPESRPETEPNDPESKGSTFYSDTLVTREPSEPSRLKNTSET